MSNIGEIESQKKRINELQSKLMSLRKEKEQKTKIRQKFKVEKESIEQMEKQMEEKLKLLNNLIQV